MFQNLPDKENFPLVSLERQWYDVAINAPDAFFQPYRQDCLERYKLRQMKQKEGERFADFILRLRQQISDCGFDKYSEDIKTVLTEVFLTGTVIEGCLSQELRRRILQQDRPFAEIESIGVTLEGIDHQVKGFDARYRPSDGNQHVNRVRGEHDAFRRRNQPGNQQKSINPKRKFEAKDGYSCFNCGRRDHISSSETCPAKGKICHSCKRVGHFESRCRYRKSVSKMNTAAKKVRTVEEIEAKTKDVPVEPAVESVAKTYYTFHSGNESNVVPCKVGGIQLDLLIDSGSDVNLIPDTVWESLKLANVMVYKCEKGSQKVLKGYANDDPLTILGTCVADVKAGEKTVRADSM